jgi:glyoxylase-like metal-dependent hydrolase (beta-lactamase superfamily II)
MFLTTQDGVVLVDAPPTIGHNLLRAITEVTQASGLPSEVTHLVYSHSHADHIGASGLFGPSVTHIGHAECRRLLLRDGSAAGQLPQSPDWIMTLAELASAISIACRMDQWAVTSKRLASSALIPVRSMTIRTERWRNF